jgi:hypothetical protein
VTEALLSYLANATWQAAVVGATGLLLGRALRPARLRFAFLAMTLGVAVCAPLLTLLPRGARPAPVAVAAPRVQPVGAQIAGAIYLAGLAIAAMRLARAALRARRIVASSALLPNGVRLSPRVEAPVTIGRTVVLPPSVAGDATLRAAALAHEEAHVRRHDYALHVALECLALPLYFHPVVILLRRGLAEAREIACDEEAAMRCGAGAYAQALVRIASLAASRPSLSVGMAATAIERRVLALLRGATPRPGRGMMLALALPLVAALACSRVDVAPAVEQATLCGRWAMIPEASDIHAVIPRGYDAFTQTIEHGPTRVAVRQHRVTGGRASEVAWSVITDGKTRPLSGLPATRGSATWKDGRLTLEMTGPGRHRETAMATIRNGRLICDGAVNQRRFHTEFRRIDP